MALAVQNAVIKQSDDSSKYTGIDVPSLPRCGFFCRFLQQQCGKEIDY
jgi:hypothetical protein